MSMPKYGHLKFYASLVKLVVMIMTRSCTTFLCEISADVDRGLGGCVRGATKNAGVWQSVHICILSTRKGLEENRCWAGVK